MIPVIIVDDTPIIVICPIAWLIYGMDVTKLPALR
jgi:hypothetical protein